MANVYAQLIIKGIKTINDVPERIKEDVIQILNEAGFDYDTGNN